MTWLKLGSDWGYGPSKTCRGVQWPQTPPRLKSSQLLNSSTSFTGAITPVTPKFKSSHLLNSSTSFTGDITPVTPKFKSSHLLNSSTNDLT
jgi:hypothetical protein